MQTSKLAVAGLLLAIVPTLGCSRLIVLGSKEFASWDFIKNRCNGIAIGQIDSSTSEVRIPIKVGDLMDSAICIYDPKAHISGSWLKVSVRKGLCDGRPGSPLVAVIKKPRPGDYEIVYDDPKAFFPKIGHLHVE